MKKLNYFFPVLFVLLFTITANAQEFKKYRAKSGHVEYKLSGDATGTSSVYWDDWGRKEVQIQKSKTTVWGMTNEENKTTLMIGENIYTWKEGDNQIQKSVNPVVEMWKEKNYTEKDIEKFGKESLESLGFKKTGEENLDGKDCEIYEGVGGKLWIWKNNQIAIKTIVKILGIDIVFDATKIELNKSVDASLFEIPENMEVVTVENNTNENSTESVKNAFKNIMGGKSSNTNENNVSKNDSSKSDGNFKDELIKDTKDAAKEGVKEGVKEVAKEETKKATKKATKKTVKKLLKKIL